MPLVSLELYEKIEILLQIAPIPQHYLLSSSALGEKSAKWSSFRHINVIS
ncbi:hypothetical protein YC2023_095814 [Brassica napus]